IIVEIKAVESIIPEFVSQVLNYLNAAHLRLGLIINFGESRLNYKRIVL
ncbi:MAG TPA: GxxExxY protein, partial [Bacteroidetes bacterium]|nr:GxxExxY protein [Bacteroidota bacterium]